MKREILFRGKCKVNGEWVIGDGIHYPKSPNYKGTVWIDGMQERANDWVQVIPESVGQYTGILDKNKNKIFEGDILTDNFGRNSIVEWGNGSWTARSKIKEIDLVALLLFDGGIVVGNIYDNPELLDKIDED